MDNYAKWSGLAFQMLASIGLCTWGGIWLDERLQTRFPVWTLCLALLGVVASLVSVIRSIPKE